MADTRTLSGVRFLLACLAVLVSFGLFGLGVSLATSRHAQAFDYSTGGDPVADAFKAAYIASSGLANLYGENVYQTNNTLCNAADFAGTAGNSMAALERMLKAFILPSMINEFACPKKMIDASNNMVMKTFSLLGGTGLASMLPAISQILSAVGTVTSLVSMFTGGAANLSMIGFGAQGLSKILGGGLSCGDMSNILGAVAQAGFSFNPMLQGMMSGSGSGYISGTSGTGYSSGGSSGGTSGGLNGGSGNAAQGNGSCDTATGSAVSIKQAYAKNLEVIKKYPELNKGLSEDQIQRMALIMTGMEGQESSYNPKNITNEGSGRYSCGILQTLMPSTGTELYNKGYTGRGAPGPCQPNTSSPLFDWETGTYFGAAETRELMRNSKASSEEWLVRAYNGGPGWQSSSAKAIAMTAQHWQGYLNNKAKVMQCLGVSF